MTLGAIYTDPKPFRYYKRIRRLAPGTWTADNKPTPPQGWRWLNLGEWTQDDDLCCDPRAWPVVIDSGSSMMTDKSHPVLRKLCDDPPSPRRRAPMPSKTTRCEKSYSRRHQPHYDNGAIRFTDPEALNAICRHCGVAIERKRSGSPWWHAKPRAADAEGGRTHG